jgi:hypothetical protein
MARVKLTERMVGRLEAPDPSGKGLLLGRRAERARAGHLRHDHDEELGRPE